MTTSTHNMNQTNQSGYPAHLQNSVFSDDLNSEEISQFSSKGSILKITGNKKSIDSKNKTSVINKGLSHKKKDKTSKNKKFRLVKVDTQPEQEVSQNPSFIHLETEQCPELYDPELNKALGLKLQDMLQNLIDQQELTQNQSLEKLEEVDECYDTQSVVSRVSRISKVSKDSSKQKPLNLILKALQSKFKSKGGVPQIPFEHFIERFSELGGITTPMLITAYIYMRRAIIKLELSDPECIHKLFSCCVLAAHKFTTDTEFWYLDDWAKLAGVQPDELLK